jgi:ATPase subunit of ABC transporter with duplicated ATPase domains
MLARRSQAEADYQIALAMADDGGRAANDDDDDEDEDGRLMDAVKELSLKVHHGGAGDATLDAPPGTDPEAVDMMAYRERERERSEHESEQLARQLQELDRKRERERSEHESEQLARQLQELDRMEYEQRRQRSGLPPAANPARARPAAETASALSNCTVS